MIKCPSSNIDVYRILGIDPGTNYMGYGVLEVEDGILSVALVGVLDIHLYKDPYEKLKKIHQRVEELVRDYEPREVAIESPFFGKNVQSMLKLGRAQGVAIAAAISFGCPVAEYAPLRVKQAIAGFGMASKEQIREIVVRTLHLNDVPKRLDATDSLAIALCHYYETTSVISKALGNEKVKGLGGERKALHGSKSWEQFLKENPDREIKNNRKTETRLISVKV
ncbi:MAG: crossover junction endodeoxyribonuclease RuvC [Alistipes sp.]|nr:crossover junction endodeoxyribonuclease RuvC [Candidatus Alistipes equi]